MSKEDAYLDRIEWEFLQNPLELTPEKSENLPPGQLNIVIERGEDYELVAKLKGTARLSEFQDLVKRKRTTKKAPRWPKISTVTVSIAMIEQNRSTRNLAGPQ